MMWFSCHVDILIDKNTWYSAIAITIIMFMPVSRYRCIHQYTLDRTYTSVILLTTCLTTLVNSSSLLVYYDTRYNYDLPDHICCLIALVISPTQVLWYIYFNIIHNNFCLLYPLLSTSHNSLTFYPPTHSDLTYHFFLTLCCPHCR